MSFEPLYRLLLLAYPSAFRRRFGAEMLQLVREAGNPSRVRLILDLLITAGQERWLEARGRISPSSLCAAALTGGLCASLLRLGNHAAPSGSRALAFGVIDATMAYVLVVAGVYALIAELSAPGAFVPGIMGLASAASGLLALHTLGAGELAMGLLLGSVAVFLASVKVPAHGLLTELGVVLFLTGSLALFDFGRGGLAVSKPVVAAASGLTALLFTVMARVGAAARRQPALSGADELVGRIAEARGLGQVVVHGERWQAVADVPLFPGSRVEIVGARGLRLLVRPLATA
ncbi:MAG TPA: NfeD family protein [Chloroflexota bacterium]